MLDHQQQDCQEFLHFLLDGISEDLCRYRPEIVAQNCNSIDETIPQTSELDDSVVIAFTSGNSTDEYSRENSAINNRSLMLNRPQIEETQLNNLPHILSGGTGSRRRRDVKAERLRQLALQHSVGSISSDGSTSGESVDNLNVLEATACVGIVKRGELTNSNADSCTYTSTVDLIQQAIAAVPPSQVRYRSSRNRPRRKFKLPVTSAGSDSDVIATCNSSYFIHHQIDDKRNISTPIEIPEQFDAQPSQLIKLPDPIVVNKVEINNSPTKAVVAESADSAWKTYLKLNSSIITDMFAGQLQSTLECLLCHHKSYCFDPFLDLSVPIPRPSQQFNDCSNFINSDTNLARGFLSTTRSRPQIQGSDTASCSLEDCLEKFICKPTHYIL